jgi:hypothetical protein
MHDKPGRLVHRQQVIVFIEDFDREGLGLRPLPRRHLRDADRQFIAGLNAPGRTRRLGAVDQDIAGFDPLLDAIARDTLFVAQMSQQDSIDTYAFVTAIQKNRPPLASHSLSV